MDDRELSGRLDKLEQGQEELKKLLLDLTIIPEEQEEPIKEPLPRYIQEPIKEPDKKNKVMFKYKGSR